MTESEVAHTVELLRLPASCRGKGLEASDVDQIRGWRRGVCFPLIRLPKRAKMARLRLRFTS